MVFGQQLKLLLWKNFTLRKRQPVRMVAELILPLILFLLLTWMKLRGQQDYKHECHYDGKPMPSAGPLPFFQGLLCTASNTCHKTMRSSEISGVVDHYNTSLMSEFFTDIQELMKNESRIGALTKLLRDIATLQNMQQRAASGNIDCTFALGDVLINTTDVIDTANSQNMSLDQDSLRTLLSNVSLNTTQFVRFLTRQNLGASQTDVTKNLRKEICNVDERQRFFLLPDVAELDALTGELCLLDDDQFNALIQGVKNQTDIDEIRKQLADCTEKTTGRRIEINNDVIQKNRALLEDLQSMDSLEKILETSNEAFKQNEGFNTSAISTFISRMFCGRDSSLFEEVEEATSLLPTIDDFEEDQEEYLYDNDTTKFCNDLFRSLQQTAMGRIGWKQFKPMIRGWITYTPDTPAVRKIIKEANSTFEFLARIKMAAQDWIKVSPNITRYLSDSAQIKQVKDSLDVLAFIYPNVTAFARFSKLLSNDTNSDGSLDWRTLIRSINETMEQLKKYLDCFNFNKFKSYATETELEASSMKYMEDSMFWVGLVFDVGSSADDLPSYISYKIRIDSEHVDTTSAKKVTDRFWIPGPRDSIISDLKYIQYGFVYIQDMIDHGIIRLQTNQTAKVGAVLQQFPYPCYTVDDFMWRIAGSFPLFMTIAWIFTASMIVKGIVYEKEQRLKEVMKVMGMSNASHWLAWFITCFTTMIISVLLLLCVLKFGRLLERSDMSVIFVFMLAYTVATISECFMFSVFFSKANVAAACAGIFYFIGYLPFSLCLHWEAYMSGTHKGLASISSTVGFGFGWTYIAVYEQQGTGMQWQYVAKSPMPGDSFNLLWCIVMMFLDAVVYGLITWYVEAVFPGQYGMPQSWCFFATKSYWLGYDSSTNLEAVNSLQDTSHTREGGENFEADPTNLTLGVSIHGLRKVYKRGKKVAVDKLTINFYEGQITSFLGHNGAGKTTTMSILTGLFPQTAGSAYIYGMDTRTDINTIRKNMGMCPQYNVLFDMLTVEEHLWFYSRLKGMDEDSIKQVMPQMIRDVGLPHKRDELTMNLSGGMKRKMSIALAFAAGSQVVILDEPTAGVDPYSRKSIWDLLLKYKEGRTIIMSTHFMEEADILGDRIAILSQGKLCCCGSSLFLKNQFGSGYYLTVARDLVSEEEGKEGKDKAEGPEPIQSVVTGQGEQVTAMASGDVYKRERELTTLIHKFVPGAVLVEDTNSELTYQLPDDRRHTQLFQDLFVSLDDNIKSLGFSSYGISDTTLEEVFLKVTETNEEDKAEALDRLNDRGMLASAVSRRSFRRKHLLNASGEKDGQSHDEGTDSSGDTGFGSTDCVMAPEHDYDGGGSYKLSGFALVKIQFYALLVKRFHYMRRSKKGFLSQIILPVIFVCMAMAFSKIVPSVDNEPPLEMHPWLLLKHTSTKTDGQHLHMFYSNDLQASEWTQKLDELLTLDQYGVGTRCMDPTVNEIPDHPCVPVEKGSVEWVYYPEDINQTTCSCSTGMQTCPEGVGPEPPMILLATDDYLHNLTGRNISDWLVKTTVKYVLRRFGGLSYGEVNEMAQLNSTEVRSFFDELIVASDGDSASTQDSVLSGITGNLADLLNDMVTKENGKVWFNNKGYHSSVAYMNILNNALLRTGLPPGTDPSKYGISVTNHPMNRTRTQMTTVTLKASAVDVLIAIAVIFAMSFIPAGFVLFLTEERSTNSKHLQLVSGVKPVVYWVASFVWDMVSYLVSGVVCFLIFVSFQQRAYVSGINAPCLMALLLLYGWAITPLMYIGSYAFKVPSSAFVSLSCVNVFIGIITTITTFILELFSDPELDDMNSILRQVFLVLPQFCLGRGLIDMTRNQLISDVFSTFGENISINPFKWDAVGRNLFSLFVQGFGYFLIVICIEYNFWFNKLFFKYQPHSAVSHDEDIDVARERHRVLSGNVHNDMLTIENLRKTYRGSHGKQHPAVDNICLGIHKGECFGLLGVNGAGKTTTFRMLTGDASVTSGDAHLCGHSILTDIVSVHQHLGYCPQFDALCPLLTGEEHLLLYARLRGVPAHQVQQAVKWALKRLNLMQYANKCVEDYSGGNKRKLSTAIALVGNPSVIFLDEPSTGMDPKARRFLWKCISDITKSGRSVVLTSHSMEECEALCNRIAIMVNGTFQCLGSVQHLKNRFGNGYTVMLHISGHPTDEHNSRIIDFMTKTFPSAQLKEQHQNMLQYQLGSTLMSLAYIFGELEMARDWLHIEHYSVCQTTLDQVFVNFAKNQTDLVDDELRALIAHTKQAGDQRQTLNVAGPHVRHLDSVLALGDSQNVYGNTFKLLPTEPPSAVGYHDVKRDEVTLSV